MKQNFFAFQKKNFSQLSISIENKTEFLIAQIKNQQFWNEIEISNDSKKKFNKKHQFQNFVSCYQSQINHVFVDLISDQKKLDNSLIDIQNDSDKNPKKKTKKSVTLSNSKFKNNLILLLKNCALSMSRVTAGQKSGFDVRLI